MSYAGPIPLPPPAPQAAETDSLAGYAMLLWRRKALVVGAAVAGAALALLASLLQTPTYRARASLEVRNLNTEFMNIGKTDPTSLNYEADSYVQTQLKLLKSDSLLDRVKAEVPLRPVAREDRLYSLRKRLLLPQPEPVRSRDEALRLAIDTLRIRGSGMTRLIEIDAESADPQFAADFVNTLGRQFIAQTLEARQDSGSGVTRWLGGQLADLKARLQQSEEQLTAYLERSSLVLGPGENENASAVKLQQLQDELFKAQADRVAKQSKNELAASVHTDSLPEVLDDSGLREFQSKIADLKRQRAELSSTLTPAHPQLKKLAAQVAELETGFQRQRENIIRRIRNEYDAAVRRETLLGRAYTSQLGVAANDSKKLTQYNMLKREVDSNRQLYDAMLQRLKEANMTAGLPVSNLRIVDLAKPPDVPYSPNLKLNLALGLFAGGFLGVLGAFLRERTDGRLREPGESEIHMNLPELGAIPHAAAERLNGTSSAGLLGKLMNGRELPSLLPGAGAQKKPLELVIRHHRTSLMAESYRSALAAILLAPGEPKVIVFTSPGPSEGKTTTLTNIGAALAETLLAQRRRILLVDADLRRPRLHRVFDCPNVAGLTDLLEPDGTRILDDVVLGTSVPGLYLLPSGPAPREGTGVQVGLLPSVLKACRREFDMVLIDTPPVITFPDARILARWADGVVLVIRAGQTPLDLAVAAAGKFEQDGAAVLGTILTHWDPNSSTNTYGRHYGRMYTNYYGKGAR